MNIVLFYHSLVSDWNHGNAHFLRGFASELLSRGHQVQVLEARDGWSYTNWAREHGQVEVALRDFQMAYPGLNSTFYDESTDLGPVLQEASLAIVHEWNDPKLVERLGKLKTVYGYNLLFHDTHHRSATRPEDIGRYDLSEYDGVLAFGQVVRDLYLENGWARNAWVWHEAADTRVFRPVTCKRKEGDVVWIGNWGDDERTEELMEFLIEPVRKLGLKASMYGVRYPDFARKKLKEAGISYRGYLPSHKVPEVFSKYRFTVHIPRRAYIRALPGIPTIRPFEALACGIPLISAMWEDREHLFPGGKAYVTARDGKEMLQKMKALLKNPFKTSQLCRYGLETIHRRHTCAHRVDSLLHIYRSLPKPAQQHRAAAARAEVFENVHSSPDSIPET